MQLRIDPRKAALAAAALVGVAATAPAPAAIVINEVYAGGGSTSTSAAYRTDFVELFNNGTEVVDLTGYRLDYAPSSRANGVFDVPIGTLPAGSTIRPLGTFLLQTGGSGSGGATDVTPDVDFNFVDQVSGASLSNTAGSVRLNDNTGTVLDVLGYGSLTNGNFETTAETAPSGVGVSMQRALVGVDTNNNQLDFLQAAPTPVAAVPEPAGLGLIALGGSALVRRRRRD